jgi:hypothetical protein
MVDHVLTLPEETKLMILAPVVANRKGEQQDLFAELRAQGFVRLRVDGEICEIDALPIGIPAEGLDLGILQPEIGILQPDWYSSDSWGIGFPEGYFSAETFHNAYPSAGMPMGRAFAEWLKDLKEK